MHKNIPLVTQPLLGWGGLQYPLAGAVPVTLADAELEHILDVLQPTGA